MNTTQCIRFAETLSQQPDGPLPDEAASHLYSCSHCQALSDELLAIRMAAQELGASEPEPPEHLWLSLRDQLASEGLIREPRRPGWFADWFGISPRFAMGGAYIALLAIAGSLVGLHDGRPSAMRLDTIHPSMSMSSGTVAAELNRTLDSDIEACGRFLIRTRCPASHFGPSKPRGS